MKTQAPGMTDLMVNPESINAAPADDLVERLRNMYEFWGLTSKGPQILIDAETRIKADTATIAALRAEAVAVKSLEWDEDFCPTAESAYGKYTVYGIDGEGYRWIFWPYAYPYSGAGDELDYPTEDDAKASAQADYEKRIRSALAASPTK